MFAWWFHRKALQDFGITVHPESDTITIHGVRYTLELFHSWGVNGMPIGATFRLVSREGQAVCIDRVKAYQPVEPYGGGYA